MRPSRATSEHLAALQEHTRRKHQAKIAMGVKDALIKARDAVIGAQNSYDRMQSIVTRRLAEHGEDWSDELVKCEGQLKGAKECLASAENKARAIGIEVAL